MRATKAKKKPANTVKDKVNEARLDEWRKSRSEIAEKSRQERLRLADAERAARMKQFREDQKLRAVEAAEARARVDAAAKAERMVRAAAIMPTRTDTDAAAARLLRFRSDTLRRAFAQACLFVLLPTFLVAGYLFAVATPFFEARTHLLVVRDVTSNPTTAAGVFGSIRAAGGAADLSKTLILAGTVLTALDDRADFSALLSSTSIDPIGRFDPNQIWRPGRSNQFQKYVKVTVNPANDQAQLSVFAPEPTMARTFSKIILEEAQASLNQMAQKVPSTAQVVMYPITPTQISDNAPYPRKVYGTLCALIGFAGLFMLGRVVAAATTLGVR